MKIEGRFLTASNIISIIRMILVVPVIIAINDKNTFITAALLAAAYLTDILDGYIARKTNTVSEWGKILDPLADKIFIAAVLITLIWYDHIPLWYIFVVIGRDLLIIIGSIFVKERMQSVPASDYLGKAAALTISLTIFFSVLGVSDTVLVLSQVISSLLAVAATINYARRAFSKKPLTTT